MEVGGWENVQGVRPVSRKWGQTKELSREGGWTVGNT